MDYCKINKRRSLLLIICTIAFIIYINIVRMSDLQYSLMYIILAILSFAYIWKSKQGNVSVFLFFILSYHIFIGGRFFSYFIDKTLEIFESNPYAPYFVSYSDTVRIYQYTIAFLGLCVAGYLSASNRTYKFKLAPKRNLSCYDVDNFLIKIYPVIAFFVLSLCVKGFVGALSHGYVGLAMGAEYEVDIVSKFSHMSLNIFTAIAIVYGSKSNVRKYFFLFIIDSLFTIIGGSRAAFGSVVFMYIWLWSRNHKISVKKLAAYGSVGVITLMLLFSISIRAAETGMNEFSALEALTFFLYSNGGSMMIFDASTKVSGYPIMAFLQCFITGANFVFSMITGIHLPPQQVSFQGHMCYTLDPMLYAEGAGLGWTVNGDMYQFAGGIFLFYCILSYFFGYFISFIEKTAESNKFALLILVSIAPSLYMLPRSSISSVFPMLPYIYAYYFITIKFSKFKCKGQN